MALKLLLDENLRDNAVWGAIQQHNATSDKYLDFARVGEAGAPSFSGDDQTLIRWAAEEQRVIVSFDVTTLPGHLSKFLQQPAISPGIIFLRRNLTIGEILALLELICYDSHAERWRNRYDWLP